MNKRILIAIIFIFCFISIPKVYAEEIPTIEYKSHIQSIGWQDTVTNGKISGTTGMSKRMEAIQIKLSGATGNIEYKSHIQGIGWQNWVKNGELSGTTGMSKRMEAIQIRLTGNITDKYDIYYRAHVSGIGWQNWVKNGELSGTTGMSKRMEAIQIKLVNKFDKLTLTYKSYIQNNGWQDFVSNGEISGTVGESKALQSINISLDNQSNYSGSIMYNTYTTFNGWSGYKSSSTDSNKYEKGMEAIKIKLTDKLAENYNVFYRVHVSSIGWMAWTKNDSIAGTSNYFRRVEAIQIKIEDKIKTTISTEGTSYLEAKNYINYSSHVSKIGWMNYVNDGEISGTVGESKRLEAIKISFQNNSNSSINYQSYVQGIGWQDQKSNSTVSGTTGESRNIEAIKVNLSGYLSDYYDIYYRTHVSSIGWLDWTKNGQKAGSIGNDTRIEAIQIKLVLKGLSAPGSTNKPYVTGNWNGDNYINYFGNKVTGFKFIDGTKYYFNDEGTLIGRNVKKVIDVSSYQQTIDWNTIKSNHDVDAVILRVGWGMSYNDEAGIDSKFDYNIREVQSLGIPYSIYIYGYAKCESAGRKEATFVVDMMRKYNIPSNIFVWYDAEISSISRSTYETVIPTFVNYMHSNGYNNVGVYGSVSWFLGNGSLNSGLIKQYPLWIAQYYKKIQYTEAYRGWQYSSSGYIDGISGNVDINMFY